MSKPPEQKTPSSVKTPAPFVVSETTCPLCGTVSPQRKPKPHLFLEQDLSLDLRPRKIVRTKPGLEEYDPLLYFIWLCPKCCFAAGRPHFEDPGVGTDLSGEEIVRRLKAKLESGPNLPKLLTALGQGADKEIRSPFQAVSLTLSAIIQLQSAVESTARATPALPRYYLRLAWLYHQAENPSDGRNEFLLKVGLLTSRLKNFWPAVPENEKSALERAAVLYEKGLSESRSVRDELDTVKIYLLIARLQAKLGSLPKARGSWERAREISRKYEINRKKENPGAHELLIKSQNMKAAVREAGDLLTDLTVESDPALGQDAKAQEIVDNYFGADLKHLRRIMAEQGIDQAVIDRLVPLKRGGLRRLFQ